MRCTSRRLWLPVLMLAGLVSGCGGGGGGDGGGPMPGPDTIVYQGNISQATLTAVSAKHLLDVAINASVSAPLSVGATPPGVMIVIDEVTMCSGGGTIHVTGEVDATGVGDVTTQFDNCVESAILIDGEIIEHVRSVVADTITDGTLEFAVFRVKDSFTDTTKSGTIVFGGDFVTHTESQTINLVTRDNTTQRFTKSENVSLLLTLDQPVIGGMLVNVLSGRVFDSVEGYVDLSVTAPLVLQNQTQQFPNGGGPLVLRGAGGTNGTRLVATPLSSLQVRLQVDTNGDGTLDTDATVAW